MNEGSKTAEGVRIENPNTSDATIVVEPTAFDPPDFDLVISGIDTTGVGLDPRSDSTVDSEITYHVSQNNFDISTEASISSSANVRIASHDDLQNQVDLRNVSIEDPENDYVAIWNVDEQGDLNTLLGSKQGQEGNLSIDIDEIENGTELAATVHPGSTEVRLGHYIYH